MLSNPFPHGFVGGTLQALCSVPSAAVFTRPLQGFQFSSFHGKQTSTVIYTISISSMQGYFCPLLSIKLSNVEQLHLS